MLLECDYSFFFHPYQVHSNMKLFNKLIRYKNKNTLQPNEKKDTTWEDDYNCKKMISSPFYSMWKDYIDNRISVCNIRVMIVDVYDYKRLEKLRIDAFNFNNNVLRDYMTYYLFSNGDPYEEELVYVYEIELGIFVCSECNSYENTRKYFDYLVGANYY